MSPIYWTSTRYFQRGLPVVEYGRALLRGVYTMTAAKTSYLFISHAWAYNAEYYRLVELLNSDSTFSWHNYSSPIHDPAVDPTTFVGRATLRAELDNQIRPASCVLIISGMYAAYSDWIQSEIDIAQAYSKPIIGILPRGQERVPQVVQRAAKEMVGWTTTSIIAAIKRNVL